jgi:hypothetical protein
LDSKRDNSSAPSWRAKKVLAMGAQTHPFHTPPAPEF